MQIFSKSFVLVYSMWRIHLVHFHDSTAYSSTLLWDICVSLFCFLLTFCSLVLAAPLAILILVLISASVFPCWQLGPTIIILCIVLRV